MLVAVNPSHMRVHDLPASTALFSLIYLFCIPVEVYKHLFTLRCSLGGRLFAYTVIYGDSRFRNVGVFQVTLHRARPRGHWHYIPVLIIPSITSTSRHGLLCIFQLGFPPLLPSYLTGSCPESDGMNWSPLGNFNRQRNARAHGHRGDGLSDGSELSRLGPHRHLRAAHEKREEHERREYRQ